jgi:uncharacterized coiled-coil protein SlyX
VIGVNTWGAGAQLGEDGQMTTPQGQFIATQSSVLARFLADAQVKALFVSGPCVPASVQTLEDRLKADETAIAGQRNELTNLQNQLLETQASEKRLGSLLSWVAGGLGLLTLIVAAVRFWPRSRPRAAKPARGGAAT